MPCRVGSAGAAAVLFAAGRALASPSPELVELWIDDTEHGDTIVLLDSGAVWLPAATLCEIRLCRDGGLERDGVRYLALAQFGDGLRYQLDRDAGELRLRVDPEALAATTIALGSHAPRDIEHVTATSLFFNYALSGDLRNDGTTTAKLGAATEAGLSIGGTLAYSAATVVDTTHVVRGLSNYAVDWRSKLVRLVAGDDVVTGGTLGGGGVIGGLHVRRDFSIDPYFIAQPTLTQSGVVVAPSTIEVYRDGQLIRREVVPAGPYRVEDFAGTTGGDTKVIVRDAFGLTRAVATSIVTPPGSALRPGLSTFDYSLGVVRTLGTASFDYGQLALLAVHRLGITPRLTLGARAEATLDRASGGASATMIYGRTVAELTAGASTAMGRADTAAALNVGWHRQTVTLAALVRAVGDHYATLDLAPMADRAIAEADLTASWSMTPRATVLLQAAGERMRDTGARVRASVGSSMQLAGDTRLFVTVSAARQPGLATAEALATFAWSWGTRTTATSSVAGGNGMSVAAAANRAMPAGTGIGYQVGAVAGRVTSGSARVLAQNDTGRFDVAAEYTDGATHGALTVAGGIVALGGTVKATRPVQGGFALVRVADTQGVRTYLDNQPIGSTDHHGELILPELQAYYGNRIRIDARDLPLDVSTQALERVVAPPRRGGVVVELAPPRAITVHGRISGLRDGQPVDISYGELVVDRAITAPIGHAGAFEIESATAGRHHGVVEIEGARCEFELEIAAGSSTIDVGAVTCHLGVP